MQTAGSRILTPIDCEQIIANLDECIALFEKKSGLLTGSEIRAKSLLTVVRNEIARESKQKGGPGSPL